MSTPTDASGDSGAEERSRLNFSLDLWFNLATHHRNCRTGVDEYLHLRREMGDERRLLSLRIDQPPPFRAACHGDIEEAACALAVREKPVRHMDDDHRIELTADPTALSGPKAGAG